MLVTLSVRRLQGAEVAGAAASSAVFFVKVGSQHKVSELQATLRKLFGLEPDAKVPLLLNGVELSPAVSPTEVRMRNLPCFACAIFHVSHILRCASLFARVSRRPGWRAYWCRN
jgi:hypothetical protein